MTGDCNECMEMRPSLELVEALVMNIQQLL